jgi:DNA-binding HxlR family transcriptional regulator
MTESLNKNKIKELLNNEQNNCPVERAMRILGGKWKASILFHLSSNPLRFNELGRELKGLSKKMLNQRLQEMEELNLIKRTVINQKPIAVEYSITNAGLEALKALEGIKAWGIKNNI